MSYQEEFETRYPLFAVPINAGGGHGRTGPTAPVECLRILLDAGPLPTLGSNAYATGMGFTRSKRRG